MMPSQEKLFIEAILPPFDPRAEEFGPWDLLTERINELTKPCEVVPLRRRKRSMTYLGTYVKPLH